MQHEGRKPANVNVLRFYHHMQSINKLVLPNLPPFEAGQSFNQEELLDIMLFTTPKTWQQEMERQGFDPMLHPLNPVVDFMEHIKVTEHFDANKNTVKKESKKDSKKRKSDNKSNRGNKAKFHHSHHGPN